MAAESHGSAVLYALFVLSWGSWTNPRPIFKKYVRMFGYISTHGQICSQIFGNMSMDLAMSKVTKIID